MRRAALLLSTITLVACGPPGFTSANQQLSLADGSMVAGASLIADPIFHPGMQVLAGTHFCPTIYPEPQQVDTGWITVPVTPDDEYVTRCFDQEVDGPGALLSENEADQLHGMEADANGFCIELNGPEPVTWRFDARSCDEDDVVSEARDDFVRFTTADGAGALGWLPPVAEQYAEANLHPGVAGDWPETPGHVPGGPLALWAGQPVTFPILLRSAESPIAFRLGRALGEGDPVPDDGALHPRLVATSAVFTDVPGALGSPRGDAVEITLDEGAEVDLELVGVGGVWPVARLRAVGLEDVAAIAVVPAHVPSDGGWGLPVAARTMVLTDDGTQVRGAPVQWDADGYVRIDDTGLFSPPFGEPDYTGLGINPKTDYEDRERPFEATSTLTATLGELWDTADLTWTEPAPPPPAGTDGAGEAGTDTLGDAPPAPDDCNYFGCSTSGRGSGSGWTLIGVLALLGLRRRR